MDDMNSIWFAVGTAILFAALFVAFRRWWPRLGGISPVQRIVLIVTTVGGLIGAFFWWQDIDAAFAWNLPPLASRLLGAAATAFGIAGLFVLERPTYARAWLHALMTAIYLIPLAVIAPALHLDRFDFAQPVSWSFFAIVIALSLVSLTALRPLPEPATVARPTGAEAAYLTIAAIVLGIWGLLLFAVPASPFPLVFVWASDPLTSRLIAAMLMTVATGLWVARQNGEVAAQAHLLALVYGVGVVLAISVNVVRGAPFPPLYLGAFVLLGAASLVALSRQR